MILEIHFCLNTITDESADLSIRLPIFIKTKCITNIFTQVIFAWLIKKRNMNYNCIVYSIIPFINKIKYYFCLWCSFKVQKLFDFIIRKTNMKIYHLSKLVLL